MRLRSLAALDSGSHGVAGANAQVPAPATASLFGGPISWVADCRCGGVLRYLHLGARNFGCFRLLPDSIAGGEMRAISFKFRDRNLSRCATSACELVSGKIGKHACSEPWLVFCDWVCVVLCRPFRRPVLPRDRRGPVAFACGRLFAPFARSLMPSLIVLNCIDGRS